MKIVYATDAYYPRTHGVAVSIDSAANHLANEGHEVHIIAPKYDIEDDRKLHKNIIVHRYKSYSLFFTTNKDERFIHFNQIKKIYKDLDNIAPDMLHIHLEFIIGFACRKWAKKKNKPTAMTVYTYYPPYIKLYVPYLPNIFCHYLVAKYSKWFYKRSDILFALTQEIEDIAKKQYGIKNDIHRLFLGVDENDFKNFNKEKEKSEILKKYTHLKDKKILLFVGRIGEEKNIDLLLKMMKKITSKRDDIHLLMVGGGSHIEKYKNVAKRFNINDYTTFVDSIPHNKIRAYYALGDIFVFSSITEAQGLVTAEALYLGIPVVAVSALGTKNVLADKKGGFLVENDVDNFVEKVCLLLDDKELYKNKKIEALERGQELVWNKTFASITDKYIDIVNSKTKNIAVSV